MATALARKYIPYAEYLEIEARSEIRHEHIDGVMLAMAGGTPNHAALGLAIGAELRAALRGRPCRAYSADLRVRIPATGLATYPDASVICGPLVPDEEDPNAATNPILLVEVLSDGTEAYDRGEKFAHYRRLDTLQHYLLVSQRRPQIEHYRRNADDTWTLTEHRDGDRLRIAELGLDLAVADVFRDWEPPSPPAEPGAAAPQSS